MTELSSRLSFSVEAIMSGTTESRRDSGSSGAGSIRAMEETSMAMRTYNPAKLSSKDSFMCSGPRRGNGHEEEEVGKHGMTSLIQTWAHGAPETDAIKNYYMKRPQLNFLTWQLMSSKSSNNSSLRRHKGDRKPRTPFTPQQLSALEHQFDAKPYLTVSERQRFASSIQLTDGQVKVWYQNRRAKNRRLKDAQLNREEAVKRWLLCDLTINARSHPPSMTSSRWPLDWTGMNKYSKTIIGQMHANYGLWINSAKLNDS